MVEGSSIDLHPVERNSEVNWLSVLVQPNVLHTLLHIRYAHVRVVYMITGRIYGVLTLKRNRSNLCFVIALWVNNPKNDNMKRIYWLTGLPCSGKTTIANELAKRIHAEILDGDVIRAVTGNFDFSREGRSRHMQAVAHMASLLCKHTEVVVALVSPLRDVREDLKKRHPNIYEIYLNCPVDVCRSRDTKGMYERAERGEILNFTGVQDQYEESSEPHMVLETDVLSVNDCVEKILTERDYEKRALLIGRWQPLHEGHRWLIEQTRKNGYRPLIGIRLTRVEESNPYTAEDRIAMIRDMFGDTVDYIVLPDIGGVYYGRGVGYIVEELKPPLEISGISGTAIRRQKKTES